MRRSLFLVLLVIGCHGESVEEPDAGVVDTGSCADIPGNLLANGSFEDWIGSTPTGWSSSGVEKRTDNAQHCAAYASFHHTCYEQIRQPVVLPSELPAGTVLEFGVAFRWIDGNATAISLDLYDGETNIGTVTGPVAASDGRWSEFGGTTTLTKPIKTFAFAISTLCYEQTIGVDHAWIRVKR